MHARNWIMFGAVPACVLAILAGTYWAWGALYPGAEDVRVAAESGGGVNGEDAPKGEPQLYCFFYQFTIHQPRLEFLFNVDEEQGRLHFRQLYFVELNGSEKTMDVKEPPYPEWNFNSSDNPIRLESEIRVVDNTQAGFHTEPITIEIYNYQPDVMNRRKKLEAGLKSVEYQHLPGECYQYSRAQQPSAASQQ